MKKYFKFIIQPNHLNLSLTKMLVRDGWINEVTFKRLLEIRMNRGYLLSVLMPAVEFCHIPDLNDLQDFGIRMIHVPQSDSTNVAYKILDVNYERYQNDEEHRFYSEVVDVLKHCSKLQECKVRVGGECIDPADLIARELDPWTFSFHLCEFSTEKEKLCGEFEEIFLDNLYQRLTEGHGPNFEFERLMQRLENWLRDGDCPSIFVGAKRICEYCLNESVTAELLLAGDKSCEGLYERVRDMSILCYEIGENPRKYKKLLSDFHNKQASRFFGIETV